MQIHEDDLSDPQTQALLHLHLTGMADTSPPGHSFALDLTGLRASGMTVWSIWDGDAICGIGALKQHDAAMAEVKSMRTHPDHLRRGVARMLLEHILTLARARGLSRISLETGSGPAFEPALALYRRRGFTNGPAFADYVASPFNQFLHLDLTTGART